MKVPIQKHAFSRNLCTGYHLQRVNNAKEIVCCEQLLVLTILFSEALYSDRVPKVSAKVDSLPTPPAQFSALPPPSNKIKSWHFQPELQICILMHYAPSQKWKVAIFILTAMCSSCPEETCTCITCRWVDIAVKALDAKESAGCIRVDVVTGIQCISSA